MYPAAVGRSLPSN